ncbi:MAG: glycosyltransferase family 2 protein [Gemmatimonadaceae bacterium]
MMESFAAVSLAGAVPAVSVIVPAYMVADFIGEALDSVLEQSFDDFEIIVVDDGAPDGEEIARVVGERRDHRIRYIRQENRGLAGARNTGMLAARGALIALLDGDDWWEPDFLAEQVAFLANNPDVHLVYADAWIEGDPLAIGRTYMQFYPSVGDVTLHSLLVGQCSVIPSAVVARRDTMIAAGMFDDKLRVAEDLDMWLRLAKQGTRMAYQCKPLIRRRVHANNLGSDMVRMLATVTQVLDKHSSDIALSPIERGALKMAQLRVRSELALAHGKRSLAQRDFAAAVTELKMIDRAYRNWKIPLAVLSLSVCPRAVYLAYILRERIEGVRLSHVARRARLVGARPDSGLPEAVPVQPYPKPTKPTTPIGADERDL